MNSKAQELITFQIERNIINLYKKLLLFVEDIKISHQDMMEKIAKDISEENLTRLLEIDYLTDNFISHLRKKILDAGNESIREIKTVLEKVDINLKK